MATPLRLPAQADIHEFSVMFTKSVKKKAKDWHDGYLKWHTFNYRAILYDDQRKTVSNEFFPNRTIHSDSELEFSNAIVQIGDQLETLQANLEHVYRTSAKHDTPLAEKTTNGSVRAPDTPASDKSAQKRIYPPTSCIRRVINPIESQGTPIRAVKRRKLGITRPTESSAPTHQEQHRVYPDIRNHIRLDTAQEVRESGWFARQDQSHAQVQTAGDMNVTKKKTAKALRDSNKENVLRQQQMVKEACRDQPKAKPKKLQARSESVTSVAEKGVVQQQQADLVEYTTLQATSPTEDTGPPKPSRYDPTRPEVRAKPRRLLAAGRSRASPTTTTDPVEDSQQQLPFQETLPLPAVTAASQSTTTNIDCVEAVLDIDSDRWISGDLRTTQQHNLSPQPHVAGAEAETLPRSTCTIHQVSVDEVDETEMLNTVREPTLVPVVHSIDDDIDDKFRIQTQARLSSLMAEKIRKAATTDEDGFLVPKSMNKRAKRPSIHSTRKKCVQARPSAALIEQFQDPNRPPDTDLDEWLDAVSEQSARKHDSEPLFLPDSTPETTASPQGLFTQIATKAAFLIFSAIRLDNLA